MSKRFPYLWFRIATWVINFVIIGFFLLFLLGGEESGTFANAYEIVLFSIFVLMVGGSLVACFYPILGGTVSMLAYVAFCITGQELYGAYFLIPPAAGLLNVVYGAMARKYLQDLKLGELQQ